MTAPARARDAAHRGLQPEGRLPVRRVAMPGARPGPLYYAQVHEDPELELEALRPTGDDHVVVVSSAGCTALALLGAGAGRVDAVDLNPVQNHLVELKLAAIATLPAGEAAEFLGGLPADRRQRLVAYRRLRSGMGESARRYWDARLSTIGRGVVEAGVSERFIGVLRRVLCLLVHPRRRIDRLLTLRSRAAQRRFYRCKWDTRRWRGLFALLLRRRSLERRYDPRFFRTVEATDFAGHFLRTFERTVTELPVAENYFLHAALKGRYTPDALPHYLTREGAAAAASASGRLRLVDGSITDHLRSLPATSVTGYALSNVCEWLDEAAIDDLFAEIVRTAAPGAIVCFRNFVGWTEVPAGWRVVVVEDRERGEKLSRRDRSLVNRRFAVCRVAEPPPGAPRGFGTRPCPFGAAGGPEVAIRPAVAADNQGLVTLAAACPMRGTIDLCVDRAPDFFALNRIQGDRWRVGVAETRDGRIVGSVATAARRVYVNGAPRPICYVSDLKVHPDFRGGPVADALSAWVTEACESLAGPDAACLLTILEGNQSMERRADGPRGLPRLDRIGTIVAWSIPLLWPRRAAAAPRHRIRPARTDDLPDMSALWNRVAAQRQLASVYERTELADRIERPPWADLDAYLVARRDDGALAGFLGLWDQHRLKQLRVVRYDARLAIVRRLVNAGAPLVGGAKLPEPGTQLPHATAVHVCVPPATPDVLRGLLLHGMGAARRRGQAFVTIGLDHRDPLSAALHGLWAQPSRIGAYLTSPAGGYRGPPLDGRPLHFEVSLV